MNVLKAAKETMELWEKQEEILDSTGVLKTVVSIEHCRKMLTRMKSKNFSYGKLCRWLGWIQASCVANNVATLEEMKEINKRNKNDVTKT